MRRLAHESAERPMVALRFALTAFLILTSVTTALPAGAEPPTPEDKVPEEIYIPPEAQSLPPGFAADTRAPANPKVESSLNQLLEVRRRDGLEEAQAYAKKHLIELDDSRVQVVIEATGEPIGDLREAVAALGGEYKTHYKTLLQALVPIDALETLAERSDVRLVREPQRPMPAGRLQIGDETSEGVAASNAPAWHAAGYEGAGVRVAVIDIGFTDYASLQGTDLPASVTPYDWTGEGMGGGEHGTACAEIIYDMAPGSRWIYTR